MEYMHNDSEVVSGVDLSQHPAPYKAGEGVTTSFFHTYMADTSTITELSDPGVHGYTLTEQIIIGCVLSLFIVLSTTGNILVCVAVLTERNLRKLRAY